MPPSQLRQPRLAEMVADELRQDILSGLLKDGDHLPRQEDLLERFRVSPPSIREALRILETEGLITVLRGNVGGAIVHLPTPERVAYTISLVLQSQATPLRDVGHALTNLEPLCAVLCAEREDRMAKVVPRLSDALDSQRNNVGDVRAFNRAERIFHEEIVRGCGNDTLVLVAGALESLWSSHEAEWARRKHVEHADPSCAPASIRDHEHILRAICEGNASKASRVAKAHLEVGQAYTLSEDRDQGVDSTLI